MQSEPIHRTGLLSCLGAPLITAWWEACSRPGLGFLAQSHILQHCHPSKLASTALPKPPIFLEMLEASDTSYDPAFKNTQVTSLI